MYHGLRRYLGVMKLVFASDSFKGSLTSAEIAGLLERVAQEMLPDAECVSCPIADGGEGTIDAIASGCAGARIGVPAHDGLMRNVEGEVLLCEDGKAFVEVASTCGLTLLGQAERNPLATTSYGVGECIRFALDKGFGSVFVALGGSCTNDGGMGCLRALGVRFFDAAGCELHGFGRDLAAVARIDVSGLHPQVEHAEFTILGDVDNPLLGPQGATWTFGRQKGADDSRLEQLEAGMAHYAEVIASVFPDARFDVPGFGAAGGLGMALAVFLGARIRSGVEAVLDLVGFDSVAEGATLVVTGEGKLDGQSLRGKAMSGVIAHSKRLGVPVAAICGQVALEDRDLHRMGLRCAVSASAGQPLERAMANAEQNYLAAARRLLTASRP